MTLVGYVSLAIIAVSWGMSLFPARIFKKLWRGRGHLLLAAIILAGALLYLTRQQFLIWRENEISKFLLPPYQPLNYFIYYTFTRFWRRYLVSLAVGLLGYGIINYFNKKYQERFFWPEEIHFIALGLFLTGHPGWILYLVSALVAILALALIWSLVIGRWSLREPPRLSFYYLWLPLAALVILLEPWLLQFEFYSNLIF